jgi:tRNA dimethylallyltransferase
MLSAPFQNALVLTGPTGAGKTQLGIELAQRLDAEIISMDSMAVYRRMNIGTAKPTAEERTAVPHHLVDALEPWESASVWWWLEQAKRFALDIESRGKQVLFVGGTPLYLKALIHGLFDGPSADEAIRKRLTEEAQTLGSTALHDRLTALDPASAERIHPNDVRRMVRALEVYELTGKPMSQWQTQWEVRPPAREIEPFPAVLWLDLPRDLLYERINNRVEAMFAAGLVDEARQLRALERPLSLEARQALGYKEIFDLLDGTIMREEAIVRVQTRSRNFAKRQIAWFRHLPLCRPATMELTRALWQSKMKTGTPVFRIS